MHSTDGHEPGIHTHIQHTIAHEPLETIPGTHACIPRTPSNPPSNTGTTLAHPKPSHSTTHEREPRCTPNNLPVNTHSIITRAKDGIIKKKILITTKYPLPKGLTTSLENSEPTSFTEAHKQVEWRHAMDHEFNTLQRCGTWSLVPYKLGMNIVGC